MAWRWKPYVRVAQRRARAARYAADAATKGGSLAPVRVTGRNIAATFWGKAWCENLESYSDFSNRLPRGRTYLRNGSVIDLRVDRGTVKAQVCGSEIYRVEVHIQELSAGAWKVIKRDCAESIHSLLDLLQGRFSKSVMERLSRPGDGLFPHPKEISMRCSCPDWAVLCKHVAAVLYGVGARLDQEPELLFRLRAVDHLELVQQALAQDTLEQALDSGHATGLAGQDLGELFGIDLDGDGSSAPADAEAPASKRTRQSGGRKKKERDGAPPAASRSKRVSARVGKAARTARKVVKRVVVKRVVTKRTITVVEAHPDAESRKQQDPPSQPRRGRKKA